MEINRYTYISETTRSKAGRALAMCAAMAVLGSCTDDVIPNNGNRGDSMDFEVTLAESWQQPAPASENQEVGISRMDADGGETLYLITTTTPQPETESAERNPQSRGTTITSSTFYDSFGLSAMCYTGTWPDNATGYCDNIEMKKAGTTWAPGDTDIKIGWLGSGRIRFFAYAPHSSSATAGITAPATGADGMPQIGFRVNSSVSAQTDLLAAVTDTHGGAGGSVSLKFGHALTAVSISTGEAMLAGTFKSVTLAGVYGSGNLSPNLADDGTNIKYNWTPTGNATSFTATLGEDGKVIAPDNGTLPDNHYTKPAQSIADGTLTFFMVPQTLPTGAKLEIVFVDELTGVERKLTADLSGKTWPAGQRVEYAVSSTGVKVEPIVNIEFATPEAMNYTGVLEVKSLQAYMKVTQEGEDTKLLPLKYRLESSLDVGGNCVFTPLDKATSDVTQKRTGLLHMVAQTPYTSEMRKPFDDLGLSKKYTTAADGGPMDLSKFDGYREDGRTESSNTYVVRTPGLYKLPLVYGNSLGNEKAYKTGVSGYDTSLADYFLEVLVDHKKQPISHQWIPDQHPDIKNYVAELLWQDSPELIRDVKLSDDKRFIQFEVREATLNQGNAHIALKDPSTGEALWSWQIYVTHYDWSGNADITLTSRASGLSHNIAPVNIGYCDMHSGAPQRQQTLTVFVTGANGKETALKKYTFTQEAIEASSAGDNTYYQWGRKDPTPGGVYSPSVSTNLLLNGEKDAQEEYNMLDKPVWTPDGEAAVTGALSTVEYYKSIAHPDVFYFHTNPPPGSTTNANLRRSWCNNTPYNVWDGTRNHTGNTVSKFSALNDGIVQKTVYDPSPRGYNVPHIEAYTGIIDNSVYHEDKIKFDIWKITPATSTTERKYEDLLATNIPNATRITNDGMTVGWDFNVGKSFKLYSTGVRDMGTTHRLDALPPLWRDYANPAFRSLTFIATATAHKQDLPQVMILGLDERHEISNGLGLNFNLGSNSSYGFPVRPERSR